MAVDIRVELAKAKERNQARQFEMMGSKLDIAQAMLRGQKLEAKAQFGSQIDRQNITSSLQQLIQERRDKGGNQQVIRSENLVGPASGGAVAQANPQSSGTVDAIFKAINQPVESSQTVEGSPSPTGRQGEVSRTSTTTNQSSGGGGLRETLINAAGRGIGSLIPGEGFLDKMGTRTSTSQSTVTEITPEHKKLVQDSGTVLGTSAVALERGEMSLQEFQQIQQSQMGQLREPEDRTRAQQGALQSAIIRRQELKTADTKQAREIGVSLASQGITGLSGSDMFNIATARNPEDVGKAMEAVSRAQAASPEGQRQALALLQARFNLKSGETNQRALEINQENQEKLSKITYERAVIGLGIDKDTQINSRLGLNTLMQKEALQGSNAAIDLTQPPSNYPLTQITQGFEAAAAEGTFGFGFGKTEGDASALVNNGAFVTNSLYMMATNNRPHYLTNQKLNAEGRLVSGLTELKTLDGGQLDTDLDTLNGNRRFNESGQLVINPGEPWDEAATDQKQRNAAKRITNLGIGLVPGRNEAGDWTVVMSKPGEKGAGLVPDLAARYIKRAQLKEAREMIEGRIYTDSVAFTSRPGSFNSDVAPPPVKKTPAPYLEESLKQKKAKPSGAFSLENSLPGRLLEALR